MSFKAFKWAVKYGDFDYQETKIVLLTVAYNYSEKLGARGQTIEFLSGECGVDRDRVKLCMEELKTRKLITEAGERGTGHYNVSIDTIAPRDETIPYEQIVADYHRALPSLLHVQVINNDRKRAIKRVWKSDKKHRTPDFFYRYFIYVSKSPFLMGVSQQEWKANFDWLLRSSKFDAVCEGTYHSAK